MILHRLRLTNFRGVADREIGFPEHGVVVVCGPNEVGKSSMLEALDLLVRYKDRSTHRDVKAVKPAHSDAGAEVEAEISTGAYRFVYRKRFHNKPLTELTVVEPRREQLTGDEAHERVEAILAETVDTTLWDAQRVLQAAATDAVTLSGCDALSRALDAAAGETETPSGADSLLVDRIEAEYQRYFTATGRPAKEWKAAVEALSAAEAEVRRCSATVAELDERVCRHESLTAVLRDLDERLAPAAERLAAATQAQAAVSELADQLGQARLEATAASATAANSALANDRRRELIADAERRSETLAVVRAELTAAEEAEAGVRQTAERAATERAAAEASLEAKRLQHIDAAESNVARLSAQLAEIAVTEQLLSDIEQSAALVARLEAQLQADAGTVEFTAPAELAITVDGEPRTLAAGQDWSQPATAAVVVDVPGILSVRIKPGASAVKLRADLDAAQLLLTEALAQGAVADLDAARAADRQRRTLTAEVDKLNAGLELLRGGGVPAELSAHRADAEARMKAASEAAALLTEKSTQTTILRERLQTAETGMADVQDTLTALRAAVGDDVVAAQATTDAEKLRVAQEKVSALAARYDAAEPDAAARELAAAAEGATELTREHDAATKELHTVTVELAVMGSEGRQGRLDEAESRLEHARNDHARLAERAAAAAMLRETVMRHRDNTRRRYVAPYRGELERLGRAVFGDSFSVDVDAELTIRTRTLDGCTVPYESLSGGAREQLGILARLAGAALVAKEDTVPVVIDDALGFSDPDRLAKMGAVFDAVGDRGQVIVLTCQPTRYQGIAGAEVIDLGA